jgi:hypothetical protein
LGLSGRGVTLWYIVLLSFLYSRDFSYESMRSMRQSNSASRLF